MTVMQMPRVAQSAQFAVSLAEARTAAAPVRVLRVCGEADPNILARIIQPMVKLDLMPRALNVLSEDGAEMVVEIAFAATDAQQVARLEHALRAVIGITSVEMLG